jgi:hypothetical protein
MLESSSAMDESQEIFRRLEKRGDVAASIENEMTTTAEFDSFYKRINDNGTLHKAVLQAYKNCRLTGCGFLTLSKRQNGKYTVNHGTWDEIVYRLKKLGILNGYDGD